MDPRSGFTDHVRQELANRPLDEGDVWAELAGLARCGGRLLRSGGWAGREPGGRVGQGPGAWVGDGPRERTGEGSRGRAGDGPRWEVTIPTTSGAVARRAYALVQAELGVRPEIAVRAAGGMHRHATYEVRVGPHVTAARHLGLIGSDGLPRAELPLAVDDERVPDLLRGAILACASFSSPGRDPHLELAPGPRRTAEALASLFRYHLLHRVSVIGEDRARVVVKSGEAIGDVLVLVGAVGAFLRWDEQRMRRELRGEATRLANADAANLRRSTSAAAAQIEAVEQVLAEHGWDELDDQLREVALVRLANPEASLQELGTLLDPPVGKSAVHRRLARLMALGPAGGRSAEDGPP